MTHVVIDEIDPTDKELVLKYEILDALQGYIGQDPLQQYLFEFLDSTSKKIQSISMAIAAEDESRIRHMAHKLKGSSGNIGALKLAWKCVELEALTVDNLSNADLKHQFQQLEQVFEATKTEIRAYIHNAGPSHAYIA